MCLLLVFFFFKQKTAYEMRISDWSSDVCSSDLDADAITSFAQAPDILFGKLNDRIVLTPHEGEFARLFPDLADGARGKLERVRAATSEEGRVGKECVGTSRSRVSPAH